jgi:hypothetical protein
MLFGFSQISKSFFYDQTIYGLRAVTGVTRIGAALAAL